MSLERVEDWLRRAIGLDAASIGKSALAAAVRERQAACGRPDPDAYWALLSDSAAEQQGLIEAVVVPETWFFRDPAAFAALAGIAAAEWSRSRSESVLRILSLPCASGEEPYSIAMALLDAGLPATRFRVEGRDISTRALARAEAALYGRNSFRGEDLRFRERHFERGAAGYRLRPEARAAVNFGCFNLVGDEPLPAAVYDAIFCRNVLIYFDAAHQQRALECISRMLAPDGYLFVGPAESGLPAALGFAPAGLAGAFAFRPPTVAPAAAELRRKPSPPMPVAPAPARRRRTPIAAARAPRALPAPAAEPSADGALDAAAALANQGRLAQAAACCEALLRRDGPSAAALYLLGLVRDAAGEAEQASDCYRKALYLDPRHRDALLHLALLLEKRGDGGAARVLHERARRLELRREA